MIVTVSGKGGVGKTTICAFLIDELAREGYCEFRVLVVDADPAMTLSGTMGIAPPKMTLAELRESIPLDARQIKGLPAGMTPEAFVLDQLKEEGVIVRRCLRQAMEFDLMTMGHGEGPGCYCRINGALTTALSSLRQQYDLVVIDNEAGLEHLSRYRIPRVDLFLIVLTSGRSSWVVGDRIKDTVERLEIEIGETWCIYNRTTWPNQVERKAIYLPDTPALTLLDQRGRTALSLMDDHKLRASLWPVLDRICDGLIDRANSPGILEVA